MEQGKHELSLHVFTGASKIDYPDIGGTKWSPGFGAAFTYNFFFLPKWSFMLGGGLQLFNNRGTAVQGQFDGYQDAYDSNKEPVRLYYNFDDYSENQWSLMFMIPVMFQYQSNETRNKAFYYALGAKLGIPFAGAYQSTAGVSQICGWYDRFGEIPADPSNPYGYARCNDPSDDYWGMGEGSEEAGFGDFGKVSSHARLKLGTAFFAAAEFGVKWRLYNKLSVYTGFWLDWALNDVAIKAVTGQPDFEWLDNQGYSQPGDSGPNARLEFASRTKNSKAVPISLGFTVRFALGAGTHREEIDSLKWLKRLNESDSLLQLCNDSLSRAKDSIDFLNSKVDALLDSLIHCRRSCMIDAASRSEMEKRMDSLAKAVEAAKLAEQRERARLDSIARYRELEASREARLADFRKKLNAISNGLDNYAVTQSVPSDNARERLDIAAELLKDYPDLRMRIIGHTCDMGTHETNVRFGRQRAESARNYLVNVKGIQFNRLDVQSRAELEPVVKNTNEANRRKNRRIQLEIIEGAPQTQTQIEEGR